MNWYSGALVRESDTAPTTRIPEQFDGVPVRPFVPVFVERRVRAGLRG